MREFWNKDEILPTKVERLLKWHCEMIQEILKFTSTDVEEVIINKNEIKVKRSNKNE